MRPPLNNRQPTALSGRADAHPAVENQTGRSIAGFRDAFAAHAAWYKVHGCRIEQRIAPVVTFAKGEADASQEMMTFVASADVPRQKRDAGWNSFAAKYRVNSEIERETIAFMPRG